MRFSALTKAFQGILAFEKKSSLAQPDASLLDLFGVTQTASGVSVTPQSAMRCAPVRCAVQAIAETIGQLPLIVYQRDENSAKDRAPDHPAYPLLHDAANDWTPAALFREQVTRDALLNRHGGFGFINRVDGKPVELLRLDPAAVVVDVDPLTGEPLYRIAGPHNTFRPLDRSEIIHIPSPSLTGSGLLHDAREAIGLAIVLERHAATLFGNGGRPDGILKTSGTLGAETAQRIGAAWRARFGAGKSGGTPVLEQGLEFQPITFSSVDSQFLELRKFAIEEIARVFRIPPIFLMEYGRATWSNNEAMGQQFLTYTLLPWLRRWTGELQLKLFAREERNTYFAEFLTDDLLRADFDAKADGYAKLIAARVLNPNEARAMENRAPYAGGDKFENPNTTSAGAAP